MAKILVQLTGLFFVGYGLAFAFFPTEMAMSITGSVATSASALMDIRATYGGMTLAVGIILMMLARNKEGLAFALLSIAIILLAMAAGRVLGMYIDGTPNGFMYGYLVAEIIGAGISLGLRHSMKTESLTQ
jgi:hypothetical protein